MSFIKGAAVAACWVDNKAVYSTTTTLGMSVTRGEVTSGKHIRKTLYDFNGIRSIVKH